MGEYGMDDEDLGLDAQLPRSVIHVREEPPRLLWRSIVQAFGWAIGFLLAGLVFWLSSAILLVFVFHQAPLSSPRF